jgi:hypothetical protein
MEKLRMLTHNRFLALALLLASPALASAQLRFTQPIADLGALRGGPIYQHRFDFLNDSTRPIEIADFRLGCGCLQPALDKRVYQPGEKGSLLMHIRTLGQPDGARTWQALVQYRAGDKMQETAVVIGATIRNEVTIEPSIISMTVGTTLRQELTIKDSRATPLKVTSIVPTSPAIRVAAQSTEGGVTKIVLEVSRDSLTAPRQEETLNIFTDDPDYRQMQVPITLVKAIRAEVTATPDRVEIGASSQLVRLRAAGDKAVRIASVEADHPAVKCTWAAGPGNDATLKISVDAAQFTAPTASVRVHLIEPSRMTLTIPVARAK